MGYRSLQLGRRKVNARPCPLGNSAKDLACEAGTGVSFKAGTDVHIKGGMNITLEAGVVIVGAPLGNINSDGGGSGAQPAAPADPVKPKDFKDPLAS